MSDLEPRPDPAPAPPAAAVPPARASDADRERVAELLRHAGAHGQLDVDELDERLTLALRSKTREELVPLTADLPSDEAAVSFDKAPLVRAGEGGERWIVSVMSGNDRDGHWRVGPRLRIVNVMGGSEIDLTEAELSAPVTEITVFSIMGGCELRVPEGARVEVTRIGLMGGNDVKLGSTRPAPDAPVVRLRLFALMGGNDVKRGPRRTREQKRLEKVERREEQRRLEDQRRHERSLEQREKHAERHRR